MYRNNTEANPISKRMASKMIIIMIMIINILLLLLNVAKIARALPLCALGRLPLAWIGFKVTWLQRRCNSSHSSKSGDWPRYRRTLIFFFKGGVKSFYTVISVAITTVVITMISTVGVIYDLVRILFLFGVTTIMILTCTWIWQVLHSLNSENFKSKITGS